MSLLYLQVVSNAAISFCLLYNPDNVYFHLRIGLSLDDETHSALMFVKPEFDVNVKKYKLSKVPKESMD